MLTVNLHRKCVSVCLFYQSFVVIKNQLFEAHAAMWCCLVILNVGGALHPFPQ